MINLALISSSLPKIKQCQCKCQLSHIQTQVRITPKVILWSCWWIITTWLPVCIIKFMCTTPKMLHHSTVFTSRNLILIFLVLWKCYTITIRAEKHLPQLHSGVIRNSITSLLLQNVYGHFFNVSSQWCHKNSYINQLAQSQMRTHIHGYKFNKQHADTCFQPMQAESGSVCFRLHLFS